MEYREKTGGMADIMVNRPELSQWSLPWWEAFSLLSGSRPWTMGGPAPIPLTEIEAYCRLKGIADPYEVDDLLYLVRKLDGIWLAESGKKAET